MGNFFSVSNWEEADVLAELEACKDGTPAAPAAPEAPDTSAVPETPEACEERIEKESCEKNEEKEACNTRKSEKKGKECKKPSAPPVEESVDTDNPTSPVPATGGDPIGDDDVPAENTFAARLKNDGELLHGGGAKKRNTTRKARATRRNKARNNSRRKRMTKPTEP
jgi:hypothetical protein